MPPHLLPTPLQRHFLSGGPQRMRHTLLPLAFCALETVREVAAAEKAGNAPKVGGVAASATALSAPSCTLPPINQGCPRRRVRLVLLRVDRSQSQVARLLDAQSSHDPLPSCRQVGTARWYQFLHQTASELSAVPAAELALQLFLTCAHSASGGQGGSRPGGGVQSGHKKPGRWRLPRKTLHKH